jgi:hypothetical protein
MIDKSVFIATPMYGGMCTGRYSESLLTSVMALINSGWHVEYGSLHNESLITKARNSLTTTFLASECEYLFFIDADQSFDAQDVIRMLEEKKDVIGGVIPLKTINWDSIKEAIKLEVENLEYYTGHFNITSLEEHPSKRNESFQVKYIGTGMILIHRSVFEKLKPLVQEYTFAKKKHLNYWFTNVDEKNELLGEDYNFCELCKKINVPIYAAGYVNVSHIGAYEFKGKYLV